MAQPSIRLAHVSDIHLTARPLGWQRGDWLSKRLTGWVNARFLSRHRRFRRAEDVLQALRADWEERPPSWIVFSGDATVLGFAPEMASAARLLEVDRRPGLAVPGNHDYYTTKAARSGDFERVFTRWQAGERVDGATYPFAQQVGPLWLVGVNSAVGHFWPWDASGYVDPIQLERLKRLLARLGGGPKILVTHYPACMSDGRAEPAHHALRNVRELADVATAAGIKLWLHGHRHRPYVIACPKVVPFPLICAGSTTEEGKWSYGEYVIEGSRFRGQRRVFNPARHVFEAGESFELDLRP